MINFFKRLLGIKPDDEAELLPPLSTPPPVPVIEPLLPEQVRYGAVLPENRKWTVKLTMKKGEDFEQSIAEKPGLNFTIMDLETACESPSSICAANVVVVENSQIVDEARWLVNPKMDYFDPKFYKYHKLTEEDVRFSPTYPEMFMDFQEFVSQRLVMAHYAKFDIQTLSGAHRLFKMPLIPMHVMCTHEMARHLIVRNLNDDQEEPDDYKLPTLCKYYGIKFPARRPNRWADAQENAQLALKLFEVAGVSNFADIQQKLPHLYYRDPYAQYNY